MFFLNIFIGLLLYNDISKLGGGGRLPLSSLRSMTSLNAFFEMIKGNKVLVEEFLVVTDKRLCWQVPL